MLLRPFRLADRLVTNGEWLEFMTDGGYERHELWLSDGMGARERGEVVFAAVLETRTDLSGSNTPCMARDPCGSMSRLCT